MNKNAYIYQEASATSDALDTALAKAQGDFRKVLRNREGPYGRFADLSAMEDATKASLAAHDLCVRQFFVPQEDRSMLLVTRLSCKGEFCISAIPIPWFPNPQHTHSFCTYMARLGYSRMLCLSVDDASDGEDIPEPESPSAPDVTAIRAAVAQAANADRLDQLWTRVSQLSLPKPQLQEVEKLFADRRARMAKSNNKQEKPDAPTK